MTRKELYSICHDEAVAYANSEQWSKRTGEEKSFLIQGYLDAMMEMRKLEITEMKKEYPKSYEECCKVLGYDDRETYCIFHTGADERLFEALYRLKVYRDAYWKIAGEENKGNIDYVICNVGGKIISTNIPNSAYNHILIFPTEEMRDAFYVNFKELINECKELL